MSQTIYELLEDTRREKGLSQRRAAEQLPTTPTTWRQWSRGQVPGWEWLTVFCEFTGLGEDDVIDAIAEQAKQTAHNPRDVVWVARPIHHLRRPATLTVAA